MTDKGDMLPDFGEHWQDAFDPEGAATRKHEAQRIARIRMRDEERQARIICFYNESGELVDLLDPLDSCNPWEPNDRCGGCGECLLMQVRPSDWITIDGGMYPVGYSKGG